MTTIWKFFLQIKALFPIFEKGQGRLSSSSPLATRLPYFTDYPQWLLLTVSGFQPTTLLKKRFQQILWILQNFGEHLLTEHFRWMTLLKFICKFWEVFQNILFIEYLWETAYFMYKLLYFNQQIQWKANSRVLLISQVL